MITVQEANARNFFQDGYLYVHQAMRQDISRLEETAHSLANLKQPDAARLARWFEFFWSMVEEHHTLEDKMTFPELGQRDPRLKAQLDTLAQEHVVIHGLVDEVGHILTVASRAPIEAEQRARLVSLLSRLRTELHAHLDQEETLVIEAVSRLYDYKEQKATEKAIIKAMPRKHMALSIPWILSSMSREEASTALKTLPLPLQLIYRFSWSKKYQQHAALIHSA